MKRLSITQLVPGMTVAEDVYDLDHELLIQKGTILTDKLITKLDLYGILTIFVEDIIQPVRPAEDSTDTELSYSERIKSSPEFQLFKTDLKMMLNCSGKYESRDSKKYLFRCEYPIEEHHGHRSQSFRQHQHSGHAPEHAGI